MLPTYYPDSGFQEIVEQIASAAIKKGARILPECQAIGVDELPDDKVRVRYESYGQEKQIEGSHVVSTIPINQFIKMLNPPAPQEIQASATKINYRSLIALGMVTERQNILNCGYIYVLNRPYNRISEMNEFSPRTSPDGENILVVEIPCLRESAAWNASKEELFDMCISSLAEDGFIFPGDVKRLLLYKEPCAYPIYRIDYAVNLNLLLDHLNERQRFWTLGRTGEFIYMDVDRCMRRACDFADSLNIKGDMKTALSQKI